MELLRRRPSLEGVPAEVVWSAVLHEAADDTVPMARRLLQEAGQAADASRLAVFSHALRNGRERLNLEMAKWGDVVRCSLEDLTPAEAKRQKAAAHRLCVEAGWSGPAASAWLTGTSCPPGEVTVALRRLARARCWGQLEALVGVDWDSGRGCRGEGEATCAIHLAMHLNPRPHPRCPNPSPNPSPGSRCRG